MSEIEVLDPATAEQIGSIEDMDEAAVDAAVRRARSDVRRGRLVAAHPRRGARPDPGPRRRAGPA